MSNLKDNNLTNENKKKAVLVTGGSSGIGKAIAVHLSQNGYLVFATVRKEKDADNLKQLNIPDLIPVYPLDLTRFEHFSKVYEFIKSELEKRGIKGLNAIVNNANLFCFKYSYL